MKVAAEAMKLKAQGVDVSTSARESRISRRRSTSAPRRTRPSTPTSPSTRPTPAPTTEARGRARATAPTTASSTRRPKSIITAGGKQALYNAAMCLFGPGDEVITHMPGWPTLVEQIKLADATPVIVHTHAEDGFTRARRTDPRGDHAAHARHHHQLAGQSDRRADLRSRPGAASPTRRRARASGSCSTSATTS